MKFSHLKNKKINMVDISSKEITSRIAEATNEIKFKKSSFKKIIELGSEKGEIFNTARCAGILAAKKTSELIPLCHNIDLNTISIDFEVNKKKSIVLVHVKVKSNGKTGVEIEALLASAIASLTIYDMCKAIDKAIIINDLKLQYKSGGKSGEFKNDIV
ncbi:MAG: cyclic pyranopterin monophosphate synthase MoaC [Alphaproteobacteria bacterium]